MFQHITRDRRSVRASLATDLNRHDLKLRLAYALPEGKRGMRPKLSLDLFHLTNARTTIRQDDIHYLTLDAAGNQATINPGYTRGLNFQPPMSARVGITLNFGDMP